MVDFAPRSLSTKWWAGSTSCSPCGRAIGDEGAGSVHWQSFLASGEVAPDRACPCASSYRSRPVKRDRAFVNQPGIVMPVKTGIQSFQGVIEFPLAREGRKANVLRDNPLRKSP